MTLAENLVRSDLSSRGAKRLKKERETRNSERQGLANYRIATSLLKKAMDHAQKTVQLTIRESPTLRKLLSRAIEYGYSCRVGNVLHLLTLLEKRGGSEGYELILSRNPYRVTIIRIHSSICEYGSSWVVSQAQEWDVDYAQCWYTNKSDRLAFIKQTIKDLNTLTKERVVKIILDYFEEYPINEDRL